MIREEGEMRLWSRIAVRIAEPILPVVPVRASILGLIEQVRREWVFYGGIK